MKQGTDSFSEGGFYLPVFVFLYHVKLNSKKAVYIYGEGHYKSNGAAGAEGVVAQGGADWERE